MTPTEFAIRFNASRDKLFGYLKTPAYRDMGVTALNWFRGNYLKEQWYNGGGWTPWKKPKRFNPGGTTSQQYGTLLSKRQHLFRSMQYRADDNGAVIYNNVPYAQIHNEGGDIAQNITITPKMRKWAWYMYYKNGGGNKKGGSLKGKRGRSQMQILMSGTRSNPIADKYKALALTKKTVIHRTIHMPKRPFIYNNDAIKAVLREKLKVEIKKIMGFA